MTTKSFLSQNPVPKNLNKGIPVPPRKIFHFNRNEHHTKFQRRVVAKLDAVYTNHVPEMNSERTKRLVTNSTALVQSRPP